MSATGLQPDDDEPPDIELPPVGELLNTLKPDHPRIIATEADFARVRELVNSDTPAAKWYARVRGSADRILAEPPAEYEIPDGVRLLSVSRKVLSRVWMLATVCRVDGDGKFAERAIAEMLNAAAFKDWNPSHFLDTAEMTNALGTGYDWFHDELTVEQRDAVRGAIVEKGLKPALDAYESRAVGKERLFPNATHNWNQVCNGGIGIGALAIADEEPELAARVLHFGVSLVPAAMAHYAPKGGYPEGPMYWKYGTRYNIYFIAALESALGTDFGLHKAEGFGETGFFAIHMLGPSGKTFNYADAPDHVIADPCMFWLANRFDHPEYAEYQAEHTPGEPLDLLWYRPPTLPAEGLPLGCYFPYVEVVTMRSGWDSDALFVGFKAGNNQFNHGNLDMGSFVLDALGERWAMDPGREEYNLPGYWDRGANGTRWHYYRERAEGHNTLVINPGDKPDQDPMAKADMVAVTGCGGGPPLSRDVEQASSLCPCATADLTPAYAEHVTSFARTIGMVRSTGGSPAARMRQGPEHQSEARCPARPAALQGRLVEIRDCVSVRERAEIWWFMHTTADIELEDGGRTARLTQNGKSLTSRLVEPAGAAFTVMPAAPLPTSPNPEGQNPNEGIRKLAIHFEGVEELELTVRFEPER